MQKQQCCIVGAGPAGLMLGLLMARAGLRTTVIEKHKDFLRDFRGDTIHPSTLDVMAELGFLDELLTIPHQKAPSLHAEINGKPATIADFSRLPTRCKYIAFMPQWDFLNFIAEKASQYENFHLLMGHETKALLQENGVVSGLTATREDGSKIEIRADLIIGADGRNSVVRQQADMEIEDLGSSVDVLWMQVSRQSDDPDVGMSHGGPNQGLVLIDRGSFWQIGYVIRKGSYQQTKDEGLDALREKLATVSPIPASRFNELQTWDQIYLLQVRMDRLKQWWKPGVLCIGDAAHAMSPIGGVGVNLAIQDAIAAANILVAPLRKGNLQNRHLQKVEKRRLFPTKATQAIQRMMRRERKPDDAPTTTGRPPAFMRVIAKSSLLPHLTGRLIGIGFRREKVRV